MERLEDSLAEGAEAAEAGRRFEAAAREAEREAAAARSEVVAAARDGDRLQAELTLVRMQSEELQKAFRSRIEHFMLEVGPFSCRQWAVQLVSRQH